jgi:hypothetical protein
MTQALLFLVVVAVAPQEALLPFDAPQVQIPADSPPFQRLLDFDGDGDADAVGSRVRKTASGIVRGYQIQVWANDGQGRFTAFVGETGETAPEGTLATGMPIAVGDLDGDGRDDFVLAAGRELWRYL